MLVRRGFWWLVGAALAGLLPTFVLAGQIARAALEEATLARLAVQAAQFAVAPPPALPAGAALFGNDGVRLAGDAEAALAMPAELAAAMARPMTAAPLRLKHADGLLASHPVRDGVGAVRGAVALWYPAARVEARLAAILLRGVRDAAVLFALCVPAAWIGTRLLLAPVAAAAADGAALLDGLRGADLAAEAAGAMFEARTVIDAAAAPDPLVVAAVAAAGGLLERLDATAAALLRVDAEGTPA